MMIIIFLQQVEFEWVLHEEVHSVLKNLHTILVECAHRFPVPLYGNDGRKMDKFVLHVPQDNLKCMVTLTGDSITHAVSQTKKKILLFLFYLSHFLSFSLGY